MFFHHVWQLISGIVHPFLEESFDGSRNMRFSSWFSSVGISALFIPQYSDTSWWRGSVVERRSLAGELSLSCARPAADG